MKKRKDKYDRAIEYLTKHPWKIAQAWINNPYYESRLAELAHALFQPCGDGFGCLTQIRSDPNYRVPTPELKRAIRADKRIPKSPSAIKVSDLPVFAEWQRRLDKELNRK